MTVARWPQMLLSTEELASTPFLVLGNKIDLPAAASEGEIRHAMGLLETVGKEGKVDTGIRPVEVFMCSILRRTGYGDGASVAPCVRVLCARARACVCCWLRLCFLLRARTSSHHDGCARVLVLQAFVG
jgi:hypothetical protein